MILILKKKLATLAIPLCFSFAGCSTLQTGAPESGTSTATSTATQPQPEEPPLRSFDRETLYDLLVAEFAGKRNRADVALGKYLKQAHKSRDPEVTARATQIARYLGAHQAALDSAILWTEIEPDNTEAKQIAAIELIRFGKTERAIGLLEELLAANEKVNFEFLLQGLQSAEPERRTMVLKRINKMLTKHPDNPQLWFTRGAIEQFEKRNESALASFSKALQISPEYTRAILAKTKVLNNLGRDQEALAVMKAASQDFPKNKRLGITYARLLITSQQLQAAQGEFGRLAALYPNDPDLVLSLALISWENQLTDSAKAHLQRLIDMKKRTDEAHSYLGRIAASENNLETATHHFEQVRRGPHYPQARIQLATIYAKTNDFDKAHNVLEAARGEMPKKEVQFYLAESGILSAKEKYADAIALLNEADAKHSNNTGILYNRAMLHEQLDDFDKMENDLRSILSREPENTAALNALGYTFADRNERLEEAATLIEKAYKLSPNDPAIIDSMGWIRYRQGDTQTALDFLRKAYKAYQDQEIAAHLGEVLWVIGEQQEATAIWKEALQNNPKSKVLKQVIERFTSP